ncbi:hypothetical protein GUITHDRAFT_103695 [Guillardia theta CCMP2712]|uniref:Uncharacterized protein n=1 Tax=Guillardia theta (strain CCMP2712) TaxID=905079 RepID=L1JPE5_GUITC|nr:hypothetical protein GUITHDRAFT_103695 [Guillardia theta CCMP2712]EKX50461.1 hypothetical protein GUITHDRAFT_103695 [Guillardia theta CCMP2712]|eukprot:XP_005837441.1 hypothetical protein GUITHDRAFT_103695 [Guillardia theta CCMP2712]
MHILNSQVDRSHHASRIRKLTADIAIRIFKERSSDNESKYIESKVVAKCFGVSSKTVRDIWDRKSWSRYTRLIETTQHAAADYRKESKNKSLAADTNATSDNPSHLVSSHCYDSEKTMTTSGWGEEEEEVAGQRATPHWAELEEAPEDVSDWCVDPREKCEHD